MIELTHLRHIVMQVVEGLKKVYNKLHGGERAGFDNPQSFSIVASKELCKYYYQSAPAVLRDVALPPNRYIMEVSQIINLKKF